MQHLYVWSVTQIILESLPVSSSGHVVLLIRLLSDCLQPLMFSIASLEFDFILHGPAILVAAWYFRNVWMPYVVNYRRYYAFLIVLGFYCFWADTLTAMWYLIFKAIGTSQWPLYLGFIITGCSLLSLQKLSVKSESDTRSLSFYDATVLGMVQGIALLPGVSRFGLTFVAARYLGYSPLSAFRYSFLIQMPLVGAAFLKGCYSLYLFDHKAELLHPEFLMVILIATGISYFAFCFVGKIIQQRKTYYFGWYVLLLALVAATLGK